MGEVGEERAAERVYGGCEGPDAMYVKLISSDGHEFIVKREHALTSGTIKAMLSGPGQFAENEANEVNFREIPYVLLQYFLWRYYHGWNNILTFAGLMFCKRSACTSHTRFATRTARQRFQSFRLHQKLPWSFSWPPTS